MIPASFVQDLLSRIDVVELVGRTVHLKKAGINYKGLCPFHGEKSPSFFVSPTRQTYHCFGCGVHGDAIRFLCEHHGMNFVEAVTDLAQQAGMQVPQDDATPEERAEAARRREQTASLTDMLAKAADHYRSQLKGSSRAVAYLKGRGLSGEVAARFALGWAPEGWRTLASCFPRYDDPMLTEAGLVIVSGDDPATQKRYDRFRERVMFPIRGVKGEVIGFGGRVLDGSEPKYLNSPETPVFVKGRELYGLYEARQGLREKGYALVTEGYMDVVALAQLGFPNAVATLGTACTSDHVHKLLRFTENVIFSFDGDAAGRRAAGRALEAALPHANDTRSFRFLFLPPEHDPDSYIRAHGPEAFEACVQKAVPLSQQLVEHASADCDLATVEGQARMLSQARPLWHAIPEGAVRVRLLGEFASRGGLSVEELGRLWGGGRGSRRNRDPEPDEFDAGIPWDPGHEPGAAAARPPGGQRGGARPGSWARGDWGGRRRFPRDREEAEREVQRRIPRSAPKTPEDRAVQILFGQPEFWGQLSMDEHEMLHALPAPHGAMVAWLERDLSEHGVRPWAVLNHALRDEASFDAEALRVADGDADPGASFDDFRRAVDLLLDRSLKAQTDALAPFIGRDPTAKERFRRLFEHWREVKLRIGKPRPEN